MLAWTIYISFAGVLVLMRSSMTTTDLPSASNRSTRCEPMKPAPPVTMTGRVIMKGVCRDCYSSARATPSARAWRYSGVAMRRASSGLDR